MKALHAPQFAEDGAEHVPHTFNLYMLTAEKRAELKERKRLKASRQAAGYLEPLLIDGQGFAQGVHPLGID